MKVHGLFLLLLRQPNVAADRVTVPDGVCPPSGGGFVLTWVLGEREMKFRHEAFDPLGLLG